MSGGNGGNFDPRNNPSSRVGGQLPDGVDLVNWEDGGNANRGSHVGHNHGDTGGDVPPVDPVPTPNMSFPAFQPGQLDLLASQLNAGFGGGLDPWTASLLGVNTQAPLNIPYHAGPLGGPIDREIDDKKKKKKNSSQSDAFNWLAELARYRSG